MRNRRKEGDRKELLKESEISLVIDTYDDIFSDFDPRPYSQRALSQDFLDEAKRASRDKKYEKIQLKFLAPRHIRKAGEEAVIKKRLKDHFGKHTIEYKKERRSIIKEGLFFLSLGIIFMSITTVILVQQNKGYWTTLVSVVLEPGGWFLFWEGLYLIVFEARRKTPELEFYKKMSRAEISFSNY